MSKETSHNNPTCKESDEKFTDTFICRRCHNTGVWQYDHNHGQPCPDCCRHDQGVWMLTFEYGSEDAGKWCCKAGCGTKWDGIIDYRHNVNSSNRKIAK